jgi:hypothetical protein
MTNTRTNTRHGGIIWALGRRALAALLLASLTACVVEQPEDDDEDDTEEKGGIQWGDGDESGGGGAPAEGVGSGAGESSSSGGEGEVNETCAEGAAAFCFCLETFGEPACSEDERVGFYGACDAGQDNGYFACFGSYINSANEIDCYAATEGCSDLVD